MELNFKLILLMNIKNLSIFSLNNLIIITIIIKKLKNKREINQSKIF